MRTLTDKQREMARERYRKWISKEENHISTLKRMAALRLRDRDKLNERQRQWRLENPERSRAIKAAWDKRNPETVKAKGDRWRKANPERAKAIQDKAKAKQRADPQYSENRRRWRNNRKDSPLFKDERRRGHLLRKARLRNAQCGEKVDLVAVKQRCNGRCGICGEMIVGPFHYDHIRPIAKGGLHSTENLQMAHPLCNVRKKDTYVSLLYN